LRIPLEDRPGFKKDLPMSRTTLLLLQVLVAAVAIGLWYVLTT
jgi:hypothetical protein